MACGDSSCAPLLFRKMVGNPLKKLEIPALAGQDRG